MYCQTVKFNWDTNKFWNCCSINSPSVMVLLWRKKRYILSRNDPWQLR